MWNGLFHKCVYRVCAITWAGSVVTLTSSISWVRAAVRLSCTSSRPSENRMQTSVFLSFSQLSSCLFGVLYYMCWTVLSLLGRMKEIKRNGGISNFFSWWVSCGNIQQLHTSGCSENSWGLLSTSLLLVADLLLKSWKSHLHKIVCHLWSNQLQFLVCLVTSSNLTNLKIWWQKIYMKLIKN